MLTTKGKRVDEGKGPNKRANIGAMQSTSPHYNTVHNPCKKIKKPRNNIMHLLQSVSKDFEFELCLAKDWLCTLELL